MNREKIIQTFGMQIVQKVIDYFYEVGKHCTTDEFIKKCKEVKHGTKKTK